jgi:hypothetical protein
VDKSRAVSLPEETSAASVWLAKAQSSAGDGAVPVFRHPAESQDDGNQVMRGNDGVCSNATRRRNDWR